MRGASPDAVYIQLPLFFPFWSFCQVSIASSTRFIIWRILPYDSSNLKVIRLTSLPSLR
jgi:hypothetical protein